MLTNDQKEAILLRAEVVLPAALTGSPGAQLHLADGECLAQAAQADCQHLGMEHRTRTIDALFDKYKVRRASMSLRADDVSRQVAAAPWSGPTS